MPFVPSTQQASIIEWFRTTPRACPDGVARMVVIARAGCGKTTTAVEGFRACTARIKNVLAFNQRIAKELELRIGRDGKTFHALGYYYLQKAWSGIKPDANKGKRDALAVCPGNAPDAIVALVAKLASMAKQCLPLAQSGADLTDLAEQYNCLPDEQWSEDWPDHAVCDLAYRAMLKACERPADGTISFDDMIFVPLRNGYVRAFFDLIIVDEAQDCNPARLLLAERAVRKGGRIVYIGDPCQAIYGWNGADSGVLDRLSVAPGVTTLHLTETRRCPVEVVKLAQRYVPDFTALPSAPTGQVTSANLVEALKAITPGTTDTAILSRKNAPLVPLCLRLLKAGVRARIAGRDFGGTLYATVEQIAGLSKGKGRKRSPIRDLDTFLPALAEWHAGQRKRLKPEQEEKARTLQDTVECLEALCDGLATVSDLLSRIDSLFSDDKDAGYVILSSIHKAKGLEWHTVYVLEDTLMCIRKDSTPAQVQEERNLAYVAYTRSKDVLILVSGLPGKE